METMLANQFLEMERTFFAITKKTCADWHTAYAKLTI